MQFTTHVNLGAAAEIPVSDELPIISYSPLVLPSPKRAVDIEIRVSAPVHGDNLPILLISHGHGPSNYLASRHGYAPVADFMAGHGFIVLQPTHLNAASLGIKHPEGQEMGWNSRPTDMTQIIDSLDTIESQVPFLKGRVDKSRISIIGHSFGGWTSTLLAGAQTTDLRDGSKVDFTEDRIKAGVVYGPLGRYEDMHEAGKKRLFPVTTDYSTLKMPMLVCCGDDDASPHFTDRDGSWHADPYYYSETETGARDLLWVKGGLHGFGGVSGWDAKECLDESPERLFFVLRMTLAYLKSQLYKGDESWKKAAEVLKGQEQLGSLETKN